MGITPEAVITEFALDIDIASIKPFGRGHINETFRITNADPTANDYLLQQINTHVFRDIANLMQNIHLVTEHIQATLRKNNHPDPLRYGLTLIPTRNNDTYFSQGGQAWRLFRFIKNTTTHDQISDPTLAEAGAFAFGEFQNLLADIDVTQLTETIPYFHHLPTRIRAFEKTLKDDTLNRAAGVAREVDYILANAHKLCETQRLGDSGKIPLRVTHNDTKFNNVLFSDDGEAICVIDLDTVMPGYLQYDFSDALRTAANTAAEDEPDLSKVGINLDICKALAQGFLRAAHHTLTAAEIDLLAPAANLLPFMVGVRFLTDYLDGDQYFKINHPQQNLNRARAQLKLCQDIEKNVFELDKIIKNITNSWK